MSNHVDNINDKIMKYLPIITIFSIVFVIIVAFMMQDQYFVHKIKEEVRRNPSKMWDLEYKKDYNKNLCFAIYENPPTGNGRTYSITTVPCEKVGL